MLSHILFWLHITFIAAATSLGFYLSVPVVIGLVIIHRLHIITFGECLLSRLQRQIGPMNNQNNFLQIVVKRLLQADLTPQASQVLDVGLATFPVSVAVVKHLVW